ncbi:MAG: ATP-binding protein, partial [Bacteroidales bacterium]
NLGLIFKLYVLMWYNRFIKSWFDQNLQNDKVLILYGPRQAGKTSFIQKYFNEIDEANYFNCEKPEVQEILESRKIQEIKMLFGERRIIVLDEAQNIEDIGKVLKLLYDEPEVQYKLIVTGSSSFELSGRIQEALTGRNLKRFMLPLSWSEIMLKKDWLWWLENADTLLLYGSYPGLIDVPFSEKKLLLQHLAGDYLFKDILKFDRIRHSEVLKKLLKSLAWQVGSLVSINELAQQTGMSQPTVHKYLDLLEKSFVIFNLGAFSKNLRNELRKSKKYYFWDNGILNAVINDFSPPGQRKDKGALWENYCISERKKLLALTNPGIESYFWRTYDGAEVDYIEHADGKINAWEFNYSKKNNRFPESFLNEYRVEEAVTIHLKNIHRFLQMP